jgi:ribose transport system ATP-binding protein
VAVLMISSDLEEVLGLSDRVLVLHEGRLAGELPRSQLSEQAVMRLATGGEDTSLDPVG